MPRFFIRKEDIDDRRLTLRGEDAHHIGVVLRGKPGDKLTAADFFGGEYLCEIVALRQGEVDLAILEERLCQSEPPFPIVICMALPKGDKMETVIQKSVELGATALCPFSSARTIVKLDQKSAEKKVERWQKIAKSAAEQCGRGIIPEVCAPLPFEKMLEKYAGAGLCILCDEAEDALTLKSLLQSNPKPDGLVFVVGAEGGFAREEVAAARAAGFRTVSLGRRILRCETAPLCVLAQCAYEYEL